MRKILSLIMVVAMLASIAVIGVVPASAYGNQYNGADWGEYGIWFVEAPYFAVSPTIDGVVSEAEWGAASFTMSSENAATVDDKAPYGNFFYYVANGNPQIDAQVWLRWDENYFYIAAKVNDYDGHSLKNGKNEAWNGDGIQFRVDPDGYNSMTGNDIYDPDLGTPWAAAESLADIVAGYVQVAGGFVECHENMNDVGLTAFSKPSKGVVNVAIAPSERNADNPLQYSDDSKAGYTTYEIALPWKYVFENTANDNEAVVLSKTEWALNNRLGAYNMELGMSLTVFNAAKGDSGYNAFLAWGSGVCQVQEEQAPQTSAGSNCVTLIADEFTPAASYPTADPKRLDASVKDTSNYGSVFYDYLAFDFDKATPYNSTSQLTTLKYDTEADLDFWGVKESYQGSIANVGGDHGNVLIYDRSIENKTHDDGTVEIAGETAIQQFYISTEYGKDLAWLFPASFTFEFDMRYTGNEICDNRNSSFIGNWFGGPDQVSYQCGYSFNDNGFVVTDSQNLNSRLAYKEFDLVKDQWYNWKFQFDNASCTMRLLIDDQEIFNLYNRYFYYSNDNAIKNGVMMIWWMMNTQMQFDNVKIYNFYDYLKKDSTDVVEPSKPTVVEPPKNVDEKLNYEIEEKDGNLVIPVFAIKDFKTATKLSYTFKLDETLFTFNGIVGLDEADYKVDKKDGTITVTITNLKKINAFKAEDRMFELSFKPISADASTKVALSGMLELKQAYTYKSAQSGDSMVWVAIVSSVMLVAIAGTSVIISKKRRSF